MDISARLTLIEHLEGRVRDIELAGEAEDRCVARALGEVVQALRAPTIPSDSIDPHAERFKRWDESWAKAGCRD